MQWSKCFLLNDKNGDAKSDCYKFYNIRSMIKMPFEIIDNLKSGKVIKRGGIEYGMGN